MSNANKAAIPNDKQGTVGLTKREHFAYGAMVALISHYGLSRESLPERSYEIADIMLKEQK